MVFKRFSPAAAVSLLCWALLAEYTLSAQSKHKDSILTYSAESKPAANTTGFSSVQVLGFNVFRYDGGISVQDVVVEPQANPLEVPKKTGARALTSYAAYDASVSELKSLLADEASEQKAYQDLLTQYPDKVLFSTQQTALINRLNEIRSNGRDLVTTSNVVSLRDKLKTFSAITDDQRATLNKELDDIEKQINGSDTEALTGYLKRWRGRADIARRETNWKIGPTALVCQAQWFGRTDAQSISLLTTDQKDTPPTQGSTTITTNACVPVLTITSGLGLSAVKNRTYAFVQKTDYTKSPPTSTQVIGYSSDQSLTPLYVLQMNYGLGTATSLQAHVAGGVGVSSSGAGTNADFFVGPSFSFARRAIFLSPSLHLTQRQALQDGYSVGSEKADLSSVPTINKWKYGFAVTITFAVLGK